jgi:serine/threonine-protein kinase
MIQIIDGLGYAHEEGVVHQDIKPSNILVEKRTKRPLIADFGIAKTANIETHLKEGLITGSPVYMSPEQASGKETDKRTDIYSLGILFLKMLTGILPVRKENAEEILVRKINQPDSFLAQRLTDASPFINEELENIILKAVAVDTEKRYQDCESFKNDLTQFHDKHLSQ